MAGIKNEYICLVQINNAFAAAKVVDQKKKIISKHPEADLKVAELAAQVFANQLNIPYRDELIYIDPMYTIAEHKGKWYPVVIDAVSMKFVKAYEGEDLGGSKELALAFGMFIAMMEGACFNPRIGESLSPRKS